MKSKIAFMLCIGTIAVSAAGCENNTGTVPRELTGMEEEVSEPSDMEAATEEETASVAAADSMEETQENIAVSKSKFYDSAMKYYGFSEEDTQVLYQRLEESKILEGEAMRLTGLALNDYDGNGMTDMLVCLYEDKEDAEPYTDGCLYLFMNADEPYYIYDDFCCYYYGDIFGDFGADIDNDQNTEIVFCVQGTGCGGVGDCQKFVIKYKGSEIERMELPNDFTQDYDCGLTVEIEKDAETGLYSAYCPYLDKTIEFAAEESEEEYEALSGGNCRGYFSLELSEYEGEQLLTGYEYLYAGAIVNSVGTARFVFDWDENGEVYIRDILIFY